VLLEGVDEFDRLTVGVRYHDVRAGLDIGEHRLWRRRFRGDPVSVIAELSPSAVAFDEPVDRTLADDALGRRGHQHADGAAG
jgi:hypothetical protein